VSIESRTLLRGIGGSSCAASAMIAIATLAGGFSSYAPAQAASASNNRGDVWVDVATSNDGPETDPHIPCGSQSSQIGVSAMDLNSSSGTFVIQGWSPSGSGSGDTDFTGTWTYNTGTGGQQVIALVNISTLLANARHNGDVAQAQQGFHFKLDLEDPRTGASMGDDKYKTFWVNCPTSTPTPSPTVTGGTPTPTPSPTLSTSSPTPTPTSGVGGNTPTPTPGGTPTPGSTPTASPAGGVLGISTGGTGGVGGVATPNTGATLPLEVSAGLMGLGLALLGIGRGSRRRRQQR